MAGRTRPHVGWLVLASLALIVACSDDDSAPASSPPPTSLASVATPPDVSVELETPASVPSTTADPSLPASSSGLVTTSSTPTTSPTPPPPATTGPPPPVATAATTGSGQLTGPTPCQGISTPVCPFPAPPGLEDALQQWLDDGRSSSTYYWDVSVDSPSSLGTSAVAPGDYLLSMLWGRELLIDCTTVLGLDGNFHRETDLLSSTPVTIRGDPNALECEAVSSLSSEFHRPASLIVWTEQGVDWGVLVRSRGIVGVGESTYSPSYPLDQLIAAVEQWPINVFAPPDGGPPDGSREHPYSALTTECTGDLEGAFGLGGDSYVACWRGEWTAF